MNDVTRVSETLTEIGEQRMAYYDELEQIRKCALERNSVYHAELSKLRQNEPEPEIDLIVPSKSKFVSEKEVTPGIEVNKEIDRLFEEFQEANSEFLTKLACLQEKFKQCSESVKDDEEMHARVDNCISGINAIQGFLLKCDQEKLRGSVLQDAEREIIAQSATETAIVEVRDVVSQPEKQLLGISLPFPAVFPLNIADDEIEYKTKVYVPKLMFGKSNTEIKFQAVRTMFVKILQTLQCIQESELNIGWLILSWFCYKKAGVLVADEREWYFKGIQLVERTGSSEKIVMVEIFTLDAAGKRSLTDIGVVPVTYHFADPLLPSFEVLNRGARLITMKIDDTRIHQFVVESLRVLREVVASKLG